MQLTREQLEQIIAQAKRDAPNETWGMIGGKDSRAQKIFPNCSTPHARTRLRAHCSRAANNFKKMFCRD